MIVHIETCWILCATLNTGVEVGDFGAFVVATWTVCVAFNCALYWVVVVVISEDFGEEKCGKKDGRGQKLRIEGLRELSLEVLRMLCASRGGRYDGQGQLFI